MRRPIFLFTDYGSTGFYVGQLHSTILTYQDPETASPVIDLMHDAPAHDVQSAAYLLAALVKHTPDNAIIVGVVDPGVGADRPPVILESDGRVLIGPGNGLFEIAGRQASRNELRLITWRPENLSASFHGRDLFATVAAHVALADDDNAWRQSLTTPLLVSATQPPSDWPDDLPAVVYIDGFGNVMTGIRARKLAAGLSVAINGKKIPKAVTFSDVPKGEAFWYENSVGLIEIAVNQGRAADRLNMTVGATIGLI